MVRDAALRLLTMRLVGWAYDDTEFVFLRAT